ncbi:MAG: LysM peptidoglycan-binding domain-containing protein [Tissierellales bacterium]|nr:LysM peptidoglycan-binding domain-containing protein [Tissierellales bacterium]
MEKKPKSNKRKSLLNRPLTKNEKILLSLLGIALIVFLGNYFILAPQAAKISELETKKTDLDLQIEEINEIMKKESDIKKEWIMLERERNEILKNYFPALDQAQIIYLLNDMLPFENVEISDYSFSQPSIETISDTEVKKMDVTVPFKSSYEGMLELVSIIKESPRRMSIQNLSMDRLDDKAVTGNLNFKVYSLEGLVDEDPNVIYVDIYDGYENKNIVSSFEGFNKYSSDDSTGTDGSGGGNGSGGVGGGGSGTPGDSEVAVEIKGDIINDFEVKNYFFIPSHEYTYGNVMPSTIKKSGKYSARLEYNIIALEDENRVYVDITNQKIQLNHSPERLSLWVYSFAYSPGDIGVRITTNNGDAMHIKMQEGISWLGWKNFNIDLPKELSLYPIKITSIYYEVPKNTDDFGVILFDKLEIFYPHHFENEGQEISEYFFYKVVTGDTITDISRRFYGTTDYKDEIMKNNNISTGDILVPGRILVLKKR